MRSFLTALVGLLGLALLAVAGWAKRDDIAAQLIEGTERAQAAENRSGIEVSHDLHHIVLEGTVDDEASREAATAAAMAVRGVQMVDNRLRIAEPPPPALPEVTAVEPVAPVAGPEGVDCQQQLDDLLEGEEIFFATDEASVHSDSTALLDSAVEILRTCPDARLSIEGHTDAQGSEDHNLALSQRRAEAVMRYFIGKGVAAERLSAVGYGERDAVAGGDGERRSDRRVDFKVEGVR